MTALEKALIELKARVERLEATVEHLTGNIPRPMSPRAGKSTNQEQLLAWLKAEGVVRDPTAMERQLAAEWAALPEEERQAVRQELGHLPSGPMASDVVLENRR